MATTEIKAEIGGTVLEIKVQPGDPISKGDMLLILESMKIEISLLAPKDGAVKKVCVEEGAILSEGDIVIILES